MDFAHTVKRARLRAGLTQSQLAGRLVTPSRPEGVWSTYVGQMEKGHKVPSEEICLKLAEVLGLEPLALMLSAYRDKADAGAARSFLQRLLEAMTQSSASDLLADAKLESEEYSLESESLLRLLDDCPLERIMPELSSNGLLHDLCALLRDLERIRDQDWYQLKRLLLDRVVQRGS